eukprot:maker-scaffold980_size74003-snap-gene-0.20 protein:Tk08284 transcript:maker-scaffold980_size74003-snap-gene-0.20-mRNA-1 annotation:"transmembrane protein 59-like"
MKVLALSLVLGFALTHADGVFEGLEGNLVPCQEKCENTFNVHTNSEVAGQLKACHAGCRFMSVISAMENNPIGQFLDGPDKSHNLQQSHSGCDNSCSTAFKDQEKDTYACKQGCVYEIPAIESRNKEMHSPLEAFFGPHMSGMSSHMPRFVIRIPTSLHMFDGPSPRMIQSDSVVDETKEEESGMTVSNMFSKMHEQMSHMMNQMMGSMPGFGQQLPQGSSGRMVVVRSGPGYHEEKTYKINPDGSKTEIESEVVRDGEQVSQITDRNGKLLNDMMNHHNPLDAKSPEDIKNDAEIIETKTNEMEESDVNVDRQNILREIENDRNKIFGLFFKPKYEEKSKDSSFIHGYDFQDFEEPKISEGLRPYQDDPRRFRTMMCSEPSDQMKWSDWVSCLHMRMGLPRWLTAATISLGIVFIIWLCLVIPTNAPKQKAPMTKAMEAAQSGHAKKLELASTEYPPAYNKLDLPPSYDDIPNLHVAVPVPDGAGPLPSKTSLEDSKI